MEEINSETSSGSVDYDLGTLPFLAIGVKKLIILNFFSIGLYRLYWFYANYVRQKRHTGERLSQFWRTFFMLFFMPDMLGRVKKHLKEHSNPSKFSPLIMYILYLLVVMLGVMVQLVPETPDGQEVPILLLLTAVALIIDGFVLYVSQLEINKINAAYTTQTDNKYRAGDWVWLVLGTLWWLAMISASIMVLSS